MTHLKFYSSLSLLLVLNAIVKPIWIFGIDRQVQNITGVNEYGTYFSLLNLSIVFGFLLDWGLTNFINRELAAKRSGIQQQLSSFLLVKLLFAVFYFFVTAIVAILSGIKRWDVLTGVMIIQFLTFLFVFLRSIVTANQWFTTDAWLSVLDKMLMIAGCSLIIAWPAFFGLMTIQKFLLAQIISTSIAVIAGMVILMSRGIAFKKPNLRFFDRTIFFSALPFAVTVFFMSVHVRLDGFLLERIRADGAHQAGIYAAAYRLLDVSNMVGYLMASFFMPFIARMWTERKPLQEPILQARHLQLMFAITIVVITMVLASWLQKILYHRDDPYGAQVLRWCLPALVGYAFVQVYGTVMTATGGIVAFCYLNVSAVVVNIISNVLLIPRYGALGCCVSALGSQVLLGLATMIFVHRKLKIGPNFRSLIVYLVNGLVLFLLLDTLAKSYGNPCLLIAVAIFITFVVMSVTKMIPLNNWLNFLKKQ
ncbi:MAG TPA: polysaccharide biosynthesis C-terminal domain-containing protein [Chitinophagaceae bacterium]|nr:polysaccharide biosynthesis C-terminal domain-containing protein [Chitinophagaceae bacterium]